MNRTILLLAVASLLYACGTKQTNTNSVTVGWDEGSLKGNVKSVTTSSYYQDGKLASINTELYNQHNRIIEGTYYLSDSVIDYKAVYSYDSKNNLTLYRCISYGNNKAKDTIDLIYTYNEKGLNVKIEEVYGEIMLSKAEKEYNSEGLLTRIIEGDEFSETIFNYDKAGKLTEEKRQYIRTAYTYDKNGNLIKSEDFENGSDALLMTRTYTYDESGRLTKETLRDAEESSTLDSDKTIRYDEEGREVELKIVNASGIVERLITYTYDEKGNMVELKKQLNHTLITEISTYTYDEIGNWIEARYDFDGSIFTVKRKIEYY